MSAIEHVWNKTWLGYSLIAASFTFVAYLLWRLPPSGYAVVAMAVVAGIMAIRSDMGGWERSLWFVVLICFAAIEIRAISNDRQHSAEDFKGIAAGLTTAINQGKSAIQGLQTTTQQGQATIAGLQTTIQEGREHFDQTIERSNRILTGVEDVIKTQTGGDDFCYAQMNPSDTDPTKPPSGSFMIDLILVGRYLLHGVNVRIVDIQKFNAILANKALSPVQRAQEFSEDAIVFPVPTTFVPGHVTIFGPIFLSRGDVLDLNIFFQSLNGDWSEEYRSKKINGNWTHAIRVLRQQHPGQKPRYWTKIDKDYPRNNKGDVDWQ